MTDPEDSRTPDLPGLPPGGRAFESLGKREKKAAALYVAACDLGRCGKCESFAQVNRTLGECRKLGARVARGGLCMFWQPKAEGQR